VCYQTSESLEHKVNPLIIIQPFLGSNWMPRKRKVLGKGRTKKMTLWFGLVSLTPLLKKLVI
jgi:hypothetical protein